MPLTPGSLKAGPRGGIISQPFHALCMAPESRGRGGSSRPFICLRTRAAVLCGAGAATAFLPLWIMWKGHSRDVWDPWHSAAAALLLFLNSLPKLALPSGLTFTLNGCPPLPLSGFWGMLTSAETHTKYLKNLCHPPILDLSSCIFPSTFNTLVRLGGFFCTLLEEESLSTLCKYYSLWVLDQVHSSCLTIITSLELLFLYPRQQVIARVWPKRTWLITVSYVNMTPLPHLRHATGKLLAPNFKFKLRFTACLHFKPPQRKETVIKWWHLKEETAPQGVEEGEQCVDIKFTSELHCDKHRDDSRCPGSNSKQLDYPPQAKGTALGFC